MSRNGIKKTIRNTVIDYIVPTISDKVSAITWICATLKTPLLKVKNIALEDFSRSGDEGNSSTTISGLISEEELFNKATETDADVISIAADYDGKPITLGVDLRSFKPFITLRNSKKPNIDTLEKLFKLK